MVAEDLTERTDWTERCDFFDDVDARSLLSVLPSSA